MGNYLSHTSGESFEPELTFWRSFVLLPLPLQLLNAKVISLPMHCITAILTCLISQALLQAALDKKERDFTGWFFQYEFSSLPAGKHSTISCNANRSYRWQPLQQAWSLAYQLISRLPASLAIRSSVSASSHGSSSNGKSAWHKYSVVNWLATNFPFKTGEKKGRKHLVVIGTTRTRSLGRDQASL
jgi:hypothetical protein